MSMKQMLAVLATGLALGGCGGGSSYEQEPASAPAAVREVPASALASARAYSEFAASLALDERHEGLSLHGVVAPTSETEEPIPST